MNLEKTASVKSVTTNTKILDAKKVNAAGLTVDGVSISEIVPEWKPREHIYRCVLEEDDDYIIYDDESNFLDCKLDTLENGTGLFQGTKGVEEFSFSLPNLTNGNDMFASCNLGEKAVESILRTIPEYSEGSHPLTMNMSSDAFEMFNEITENVATTPGTISYKGWDITSNAIVTLPAGFTRLSYLETNGSQYINTKLNANETSEAICTWERIHEGEMQAVYCSDETNNFFSFFTVAEWSRLRFDFGQIQQHISDVYNGGVVTSRHSAMGVTLDGVQIRGPYTVNPFEAVSIYLFARYPKAGWRSTIRMFRWSLITNGVRVCNMIPALNTNTGSPCMFDLVTGEPFYNELEGDFTYPESATAYSLRQPVPTYAKMTKHGVQKLYHLPEGYEGSEDEYAQENGFKLLTENKRPEEGSWRPEWVETDNELILNWIEVEEEMTNV